MLDHASSYAAWFVGEAVLICGSCGVPTHSTVCPLHTCLALLSVFAVSHHDVCRLMSDVRVTLLQSANSILTTFSGSLQKRALDNFKATGVNVRLAVRVTKVTREHIELKVDGKEELMEYGLCVWSTGQCVCLLVCVREGYSRWGQGGQDEACSALGRHQPRQVVAATKQGSNTSWRRRTCPIHLTPFLAAALLIVGFVCCPTAHNRQCCSAPCA